MSNMNLFALLVFVCTSITVSESYSTEFAQSSFSNNKTKIWYVSDANELQAACKALVLQATTNKEAAGGAIILSPGHYKIKEPLVFSNAIQMNIVGNGWNTTIEKVGAGNAIVFDNVGHSAIRNLKLLGDSTAEQGAGIVFRNSSSNLVDLCRIMFFAQSGIRFEGNLEKPMSSNTVSNCHFISNRNCQLYSCHNNDFYFVQNQFGTHIAGDDPNIISQKLPLIGVWLDHSSAGSYTLNYHWENDIAFKLGPGSNYNRIENNRFEESHKNGIVIGDQDGDVCVFNIFQGNTIHTNSKFNYGKYDAVIAYNCLETTFCDNQIFSWNMKKVIAKHCLVLKDGCNNWIIKDNIMRHNAIEPAIVLNDNGKHLVKDNLVSDKNSPYPIGIPKTGMNNPLTPVLK